jgi:hypothetical protein
LLFTGKKPPQASEEMGLLMTVAQSQEKIEADAKAQAEALAKKVNVQVRSVGV